jgi:hypothetical protein
MRSYESRLTTQACSGFFCFSATRKFENRRTDMDNQSEVNPREADSAIADLLEQAYAVIQEQVKVESGDGRRIGLLNTLEMLLHQPLRAAHLLVDRDATRSSTTANGVPG